jgi:hypothetical protein
MPVEGINRRSRTGTLLRRHKGRKKAGSVVHFAAAIYKYLKYTSFLCSRISARAIPTKIA